MPAYLLHYVDIAKNLQVLKFEEPKLADVYAFEHLSDDRTAKVVEGEDSFRDRTSFSMGLLVAIYNGLGPDKFIVKFENHDAAARRTFALLYAKFNQLELTPVEVAPSSEMNLPPKETSVTKASSDTKVKKVKAPGVARNAVTKRPAGLVADFKQTREGTDRAAILELMDGTKSPEQIGTKMGGGKFVPKYIMAHAYCLSRDCGIGYELTTDGKLLALYPGKKTFEDAIKPLAEKKAPAPKSKSGAAAEATA